MEEAIVLYPSPAIGHLIAMVELGKLILSHYPSLSIKILITTPAYNAGSTGPFINQVSATTTSITFHHLPIITLPPHFSSTTHHETLAFEVLRLSNPHVHQTLLTISQTHTIHCLIIDLFCTAALSVAADGNIPCYYFYTSPAGCLIAFLHLPKIHRTTTKSLKEMDTKLDFPGLPPIPASDMAKPVLDRTDICYEYFLAFSSKMPKSAGIIINTFELLEKGALEALRSGLGVPDGPTPPIFCIGPLIAGGDDQRRDSVKPSSGEVEWLRWLNSQPSGSVVFLCFGSLGLFSVEQLKEIAVGLERSGQRFLWVVRSPPPEDHSKRFLAPPEPDLDLLLSEGFLDRTKERGLVVRQWAPQVAVLNHDSVGGFVTHCGWNSVLEAVCAGVPMVAWPLYAEQRFNRVLLVEGMKLALSMDESKDGFVSSDTVEKRVRGLMESEEGNLVRKRTLEMKVAAKEALSEGGSSHVALGKLIESWKRPV